MAESNLVPELTNTIKTLIEKKASGKKFIFSLTLLEEQTEKVISCESTIASNIEDSKTPFVVVRAVTGAHWQTTKALLSKFDLNNPQRINSRDKNE